MEKKKRMSIQKQSRYYILEKRESFARDILAIVYAALRISLTAYIELKYI